MTAHTTIETSSSDAAEFLRSTERSRLRALVDGDIVLAQQLHAPDFQLITPRGIALSRDEYLGAIRMGQINYQVWEPSDMAVRVYDGVGIIRYRAKLEVVFGGHKVPLSAYWHTDTYEVTNGQWQVVWSQATAIT